MRRLYVLSTMLLLNGMAYAAPVSVLFVGNSYTFGRVDPVMSYNTANVRDLTDIPNSGGNAFEPHPWGGVAGIFKQFTVQAGLDYDVAMSARNAASLRGHMLNTNGVVDLRGNIGSQAWDKVVLQEQSDEPLARRPGLASNPDWFRNYVNKLENFIHDGAAHSYRERDFFPGATAAERTAACQAATGASATTCNTLRNIPANGNASAATDVFLYQTWARPNLVDGAFVSITDPVTGAVTRTTTPATTFFANLEAMTDELKQGYADAAAMAATDGGSIKGIAPVGEAFMRAVTSGLATRDFYGSDALTDGLLDLWFDDGTHASKYGSYLSALVLFGSLTGLDPAMLGGSEIAALDLGIGIADALILQRIASDQLGFVAKVPEPAAWSLALLVLGAAALGRRRRALPCAGSAA
jgi:MYXO-CTERM domain-containing protein